MLDIVSELLQELSKFPGRESGLRNIPRYHIYKTLYYRSSDFSHSKRVAWLTESIAPFVKSVLGEEFDLHRALVLALVHDDAELLIGDHQAGNKMKMTPEQLQALVETERQAIRRLAAQYPSRVGGFMYAELLEEVLDMKSPEAQVVKYIDRFDAMGEALHELYAGNVCMNTPVTTEYGLITLPFQSYYETLPKMISKHEALGQLDSKHVFFELPAQRDWAEVVLRSKPHTVESLSVPTDHPQYDAWKKVVLTQGDSEEIENLYTQREFL